MNVSAGAQRTVPRALVLALLVGGSGAFAAPAQQSHPGTGGAPGHQRADLDGEPAADTVPLAAAGPATAPAEQSPPRPPAPPLPLTGPAWELDRVLELFPLPAPHLPGLPPVSAPGLPHLTPSAARPVFLPALPVAVPAPGAAPAAPAGVPHPADGSGRHAARTRPADTGRSSRRHTGEHRAHSHRRDIPVTLHTTGGMNWVELARCEADGNPHAVDPSGRYGGLYQFDGRTWHSLGGHGLPQDASPSEQTARARELYQRRGVEPWPACGPRAAG